MRTILLASLFMLAFLLAGTSAQAEKVLYCQSELATGIGNRDGTWETGSFTLERWTLKFTEDYTTLKGLPGFDDLICVPQFPNAYPHVIICRQDAVDPSTFSFNTNSMRFVYANLSMMAFLMNRTDTNEIYAGTCVEF